MRREGGAVSASDAKVGAREFQSRSVVYDMSDSQPSDGRWLTGLFANLPLCIAPGILLLAVGVYDVESLPVGKVKVKACGCLVLCVVKEALPKKVRGIYVFWFVFLGALHVSLFVTKGSKRPALCPPELEEENPCQGTTLARRVREGAAWEPTAVFDVFSFFCTTSF